MKSENRISKVIFKTIVFAIFLIALGLIDSFIGSTIGAEMNNSLAMQQMNNDDVSSYGIIVYQYLQNFKPWIVIAVTICVYLNDIIYAIKKIKGEE